ncbi:unnamed protein product [Spirodela intermedia]|uniref:Auxin response factor n=1 Tax=Spirodela intermedia TaxID=51605 RepID=A0A7I8IXX6_SPIIN|nr:unnamed protein product [Spirodela intermedia]CAA6662443.1 unnamed protein product [Spirodela intermedia]
MIVPSLSRASIETMKEPDKCLDSKLWHACAGGMHSQGIVDFGRRPRIPSYLLCRVFSIDYMADEETDEVFARMKLVPSRADELDYYRENVGLQDSNGSDLSEKPPSFAKTLTQSDANNGGGFSVPRYCAETIFPRLDYSADPPAQTVLAKDVHGEVWKFRHIYRGTPRRHLLTTGWSSFVNQKKLVAGDSIVFLRTERGELCTPSGWNTPSAICLPPPPGGFSLFSREDESKPTTRSNGCGGSPSSGWSAAAKGRLTPEAVIKAVTLAANGQPFEVVYYPRASTPEFCVRTGAVKAALRINWCSGMRFKMAFETEDSSRISWFMGTISSVQCADALRWPDSPWRILQVSWDEPDLLQNVKCVNPWLVELVSSVPAVHLMMPFSPPRKKLCLSQAPPPSFPLDGHVMSPLFSGELLEACGDHRLCSTPDGAPAGIQGARHAQFGISLSDLCIHKLQSGLLEAANKPCRLSSMDSIAGNQQPIRDDVTCLLVGNSSSSPARETCGAKAPHFLLFGQPILTEQQISLACGEEAAGPVSSGKAAEVLATGSGSAVGPEASSSDGSLGCKDGHSAATGPPGLDTGLCKVFLRSEGVARSLDLLALGSYEELRTRLTDMFGLKTLEMKKHVLYEDVTGAVRHTGAEPFSDFARTARRLQILASPGRKDAARR